MTDVEPDPPVQTPGSPADLVEVVAPILVPELVAHRGRWVLLIDGGSGSGKTSLATGLAARLAAAGRPPQVVSMDAFYPGWDGLAAASVMVVDDVLRPADPGYRRWDWVASRPGDRVPISLTDDLIVEGSGALTPASAARATLSLWLEADSEVRKHRALARDGDGFAAHWNRWAGQEQAHWAAHRPRDLADHVVDVAVCTARRRPDHRPS